MRIRNIEMRDWNELLGAGCYQFAVGMFDHRPLLIGDYIGERRTWRHTNQQILNTLKKELEYLGFSVRDSQVEEIPRENERKIFLEREIQTGYYHFLWWNPETATWWGKEADRRPKEEGRKPVVDNNHLVEGWCFILS